MRRYHLTDMSDETVDLDNESIYSGLPSTEKELFNRMLQNIGYALSYMDFIWKDSFPLDARQRVRVNELITKFWSEGREERWPGEPEREANQKRFDPRWLKEQIFIFEDEIENMC